MIAITTYTEPIPVDVSVNEPPFIRDRDEKEEKIESGGSFAELLAGMLQKTEAVDLSSAGNIAGSSDDQGFNVLAAEQNEDGYALLAGDFSSGKSGAVSSALENGADSADIDLSDTAAGREYQNILSADHLFSNVLNEAKSGADIDALALDIDSETLNSLAELASKIDLASGDFKSGDFASIAEKIIKDPASVISAETIASESNGKRQIKEGADPLSDAKNKPVKSEGDSLFKNNIQDALAAKIKAGEENASSLNKRDESGGRLDRAQEFRKSRRGDKISVEVRDLRTAANGSAQTAGTLVETAAGRALQQSSSANGEITMDLRLPENANAPLSQASWDVKAGSALENMLARELHNNFNGDIVRHASVALKDAGAGTIKIALHPETLGNVKIHLELTDNKITGRIIVESADAMNAFRKEMSALEQAFKDSGFADANLDLSLTADGEKSGGQDENAHSSQYAAFSYEDSYDQKTSAVIDVFFGTSGGRNEVKVNMLA